MHDPKSRFTLWLCRELVLVVITLSTCVPPVVYFAITDADLRPGVTFTVFGVSFAAFILAVVMANKLLFRR